MIRSIKAAYLLCLLIECSNIHEMISFAFQSAHSDIPSELVEGFFRLKK